MKKIIKGITKIKDIWKDYDIVIEQIELENGNISGTYEGVKKMSQSSKKITNNELLEFFNKKFDGIEKRLDNIEKRLDNIDSKIDLIIACPTIQKEIDHDALSKLN